MAESSEDELVLSPEALAALQEFYTEREEIAKIEQATLEAGAKETKEAEQFTEDWQLSQFWYDEKTSKDLLNELVRVLEQTKTELKDTQDRVPRVACMCTPSIFRALFDHYKPIGTNESELEVNFTLFEVDRRFQYYGERYQFYDFNDLESIPQSRHKQYDIICIDPPFLNQHCFSLIGDACKLLSRSQDPKDPSNIAPTRVIWISSHVTHDLVIGLFKDMKVGSYEPKHSNNVAHDFQVWSNYDCGLG